MGSVLGWSPSSEFFASYVYAAAISAVIGFTRSVAASYACQDLRANVIAPTLVESPMSQRAQDNATIMAFIANKQPLDGGRVGLPHELDGAALLLLSDASRCITGQVLAVDGGGTVSEDKQ